MVAWFEDLLWHINALKASTYWDNMCVVTTWRTNLIILIHERTQGIYQNFQSIDFPYNVITSLRDYWGWRLEELLTFLFIENIKERKTWTGMHHKYVQIVRFSSQTSYFGWEPCSSRLCGTIEKLFPEA